MAGGPDALRAGARRLPQKHGRLLSTHPSRRIRFERGARASARLDQPNICTTYDLEQTDGLRFISPSAASHRGIRRPRRCRRLRCPDFDAASGGAVAGAAQRRYGRRKNTLRFRISDWDVPCPEVSCRELETMIAYFQCRTCGAPYIHRVDDCHFCDAPAVDAFVSPAVSPPPSDPRAAEAAESQPAPDKDIDRTDPGQR